MKKVLMIIPAYNEQDNILKTYNSIVEYKNNNSLEYELNAIVINDRSTDETLKILKKNNIPYINLIHNLGIGGAVQTGYKYAYDNNYDIAVQFDGDGQHDIQSLNNVVLPILSGEAEFVVGSRFVADAISTFKSSLARRIGIKIISWEIKLVSHKKLYDITSGYRGANKDIIRYFAHSYPLEYPEPITNSELLKMNRKVKEVPVNMHEREGGESSIHSWKNFYFMINIFLSVFAVGLRRMK